MNYINDDTFFKRYIMSKNFVKVFCVSLIVTIFISIAPMPANAGFINGSFELGTDPGSYLTLNGDDSSAITGWTVVGGTNAIDYIGSYWDASDGYRSLDLNGNPGPGGIEQIVNTICGKTYEITFDMAGNPDGGPTIKSLNFRPKTVISGIFKI